MRPPLLALVLLPLWLSDSRAQRPQPAAQPRPVVRAVRAMAPEATRVKPAKVPDKAAGPQARAAEQRVSAVVNALQARPPKAARRDTLIRR